MQKNKSINQLAADFLWGELTDEERSAFQERLQSDETLRNQFEQFTDGKDLARRYREYAGVEVRRLEVRGEKKILRYAAAILLFIIGGAAWWYNDYTRVTPPEISEAVQLAMQMSKESGKMEAEVVDESGEWRVESGGRNASSAGNQQQDYSPSTLPTPPSSDISAEDILSARRITTYHDKEYWVTLDDGTLVHLNYNTHLIYPEKFGRKNRTVILDGEAYFMVAKDRSRPFIVHTPNGDVKVYGTEFNVNTRADIGGGWREERGGRNASSAGNQQQDYSPSTLLPPPSSRTTTVVLVHGSVSVTPTNGKEQLLKPGQQAMFNPQSSTFNVQSVDVEPYVAWNTGAFFFRSWPLERIMDVLCRWYGCHVEYTSDTLRHKVLTGSFSRYDGIDTIAESLETVTGLRFTVQSNTIIINQ